MKKRFLSILLILCMAATLLPVSMLAEEEVVPDCEENGGMHSWNPSTGVCTVCDAVCDHKEYERDTGLCSTCSMPHNHTGYWEENPSDASRMCSVCHYQCTHAFYDAATGTCTVCDAAHDHTDCWEAGKCRVCKYSCDHSDNANDAGCEQDVDCSVCGLTLSATGHDWTNENGVCANCGAACNHVASTNQPSCMVSAACSICGGTIEAIGHEYDDSQANGICTREDCGAECPHDGEKKSDGRCAVCGKNICDHSDSTTHSTCTADAICSVCNEEILAQGHDWSNCDGQCARTDCGAVCSHTEDDLSCWQEREDGTSVCSICGLVCEHAAYNDDGVDGVGCTSDGTHWYRCKLCNHRKGESVSATGHDWSNLDGVCKTCAAECPHAEYDDNGVCTQCGKAEPEPELTPEPTAEPTTEPTAEPTSEPTTEPTEEPTTEPTAEPTTEPTAEPTTEPTAEPTSEPTAEPTSEPTLEPTPTHDPIIEPVPVPTVQVHTHSYASRVTTKADCENPGVRTYACTCGARYIKSIPAQGHDYSSTFTEATCGQPGTETRTCTVCNYSDTSETAPATGDHHYSLCGIHDGKARYRCEVCGAEREYSATDVSNRLHSNDVSEGTKANLYELPDGSKGLVIKQQAQPSTNQSIQITSDQNDLQHVSYEQLDQNGDAMQSLVFNSSAGTNDLTFDITNGADGGQIIDVTSNGKRFEGTSVIDQSTSEERSVGIGLNDGGKNDHETQNSDSNSSDSSLVIGGRTSSDGTLHGGTIQRHDSESESEDENQAGNIWGYWAGEPLDTKKDADDNIIDGALATANDQDIDLSGANGADSMVKLEYSDDSQTDSSGTPVPDEALGAADIPDGYTMEQLEELAATSGLTVNELLALLAEGATIVRLENGLFIQMPSITSNATSSGPVETETKAEAASEHTTTSSGPEKPKTEAASEPAETPTSEPTSTPEPTPTPEPSPEPTATPSYYVEITFGVAYFNDPEPSPEPTATPINDVEITFGTAYMGDSKPEQTIARYEDEPETRIIEQMATPTPEPIIILLFVDPTPTPSPTPEPTPEPTPTPTPTPTATTRVNQCHCGNPVGLDETTCDDCKKKCVPSGTLITLADGTQKPVENLTADDRFLVFDHENGGFATATANFIENNGDALYTIVNLAFSDGSATRLIGEHGYFDLDEMQYVYITAENCADYIGHRFYKASIENGEYVHSEATLVDASVTEEYTGCWELVTCYHLNHYVDGFLSMPGFCEGFFNFFAYDDDLRYNAEDMKITLETYGLFDYANVAEWMTPEEFASYPAQYLAVSIGKGKITLERIEEMIETYVSPYR